MYIRTFIIRKEKGKSAIENVAAVSLDHQFKKGELEESAHSRQRTTSATFLAPYIGHAVEGHRKTFLSRKQEERPTRALR